MFLNLMIAVLLLPSTSFANRCPAHTSLARSCGNLVCERKETAQNCALDCADSSTQIIPYYFSAYQCDPVQIFYPKSIEEAQNAMITSVSSGKHVRVIGTVHSSSEITCAIENVISTKNLTQIRDVEDYQGQPSIYAESGAKIWDIMNKLDSQGYAIGYNVPGFGGLSVGGFLATGAHGSSVNGVGGFASSILAIELMDPSGKITEYHSNNTSENHWRSLRANIGLLGLVTGVRIKVIPQFNIDMKVTTHSENELIQNNGFKKLTQGCDYVFGRWSPEGKKVMILCGAKTDAPAREQASNELFNPDVPESLLKQWVPLLQWGACRSRINCMLERMKLKSDLEQPPLHYLENGKKKTAWQVVGKSHRMTTALLQERFPHFSQIDWEVALPETDLYGALEYLRQHFKKTKTCLPAIGVVIRYDQITRDTWLSGNAESPDPKNDRTGFSLGDRIVHLEIPIFAPFALDAKNQKEYLAPYKDAMKGLITYYRGRPHWGKNQTWIHADSVVQARNSARREKFQESINHFDPFGVFKNDFSRKAGFTWPKEGQDFRHYYR